MLRYVIGTFISALIAVFLYTASTSGVGEICGGDFDTKQCKPGLVCVPKHPQWSSGMGTSGTCQPQPNDNRSVNSDRPTANGTFPETSGMLVPPVKGTPTVEFKGTTRIGGTSKGLVWEPVSPAEVISPAGGHVVHAGDFRGYGNLIIINVGNGYHLLIAGLSTLTVKQGDVVTAGALLGKATKKSAKPAGSNPTGPRPVDPTVYFELRKDGQPIDPAPWMPTPN